MALTQILTKVLYSGAGAPGTPPTYPTQEAVYYQLVPGGTVITHVWNITTQTWVAAAGSDQNWSIFEACGWYGPHNETFRISPTHSLVPFNGVWFPHFSVSVASTSTIDFEIQELTTGLTIATGTFPANALEADAATCSLVDSVSTPITSVSVSLGELMICVPVGGHAAMPADGETFACSGHVVI